MHKFSSVLEYRLVSDLAISNVNRFIVVFIPLYAVHIFIFKVYLVDRV